MIYRNEPLRIWRLVKHWTLSRISTNPEHAMEVDHYRGIKHFIRYPA